MFKLKPSSTPIPVTMKAGVEPPASPGYFATFWTFLKTEHCGWQMKTHLNWGVSLERSRAPSKCSLSQRLFGMLKMLRKTHLTKSLLPFCYCSVAGHGRLQKAKAPWPLQKQPKAGLHCRHQTSSVITGNSASFRTQMCHLVSCKVTGNC